jgi:hypothetical protein
MVSLGCSAMKPMTEIADVYDSAADPATGARLWGLTEDVLSPLPI